MWLELVKQNIHCVSLCGTDDMSISGFKDAISEQSATESAAEAAIGQEQEGGVSPDTVSATSQSTDDPTKDIVRYQNFETPGKKSLEET